MAGVKLGCKLFAMKSVPVQKLHKLRELYQKFKVKQGDMVPFTFDVSDQSSLWNNLDKEGQVSPPPPAPAFPACATINGPLRP